MYKRMYTHTIYKFPLENRVRRPMVSNDVPTSATDYYNNRSTVRLYTSYDERRYEKFSIVAGQSVVGHVYRFYRNGRYVLEKLLLK